MRTQQPHQAANLRFVQIRRRTAAPVQLINLAASKKRSAMNNLLLKHIQILVSLMLLAGDDFVAAAEIAEFMAKRDMHV